MRSGLDYGELLLELLPDTTRYAGRSGYSFPSGKYWSWFDTSQAERKYEQCSFEKRLGESGH